jgi:predicted dehydrogenase
VSEIKTAVVGVGHLGSLHARIYSEMKQAELTGVYDIDSSLSAEIADRFKVRRFDYLEEVAESAQAVSLAVPTDLHYTLGKFLLERGIHLLVEKPITEHAGQAAELVELARSRGATLQVGHVERFNPALLAAGGHIRDSLFIDSLRLAPFNLRGTEVPVVLDLMIHDIDIILSIVAQPVVDVSASGLPVITDKVDIASARLSFESGAVANVVASRVSMKRERKMRFFSTECYTSVDLLKKAAVSYRKKPGMDFSEQSLRSSGLTSISAMSKLVDRKTLKIDKRAEPLVLELEDFIECVACGRRPVVDGSDGLRALEVADRIMKSIDESLSHAGLAVPAKNQKEPG